jgi:hypothetical protein
VRLVVWAELGGWAGFPGLAFSRWQAEDTDPCRALVEPPAASVPPGENPFLFLIAVGAPAARAPPPPSSAPRGRIFGQHGPFLGRLPPGRRSAPLSPPGGRGWGLRWCRSRRAAGVVAPSGDSEATKTGEGASAPGGPFQKASVDARLSRFSRHYFRGWPAPFQNVHPFGGLDIRTHLINPMSPRVVLMEL